MLSRVIEHAAIGAGTSDYGVIGRQVVVCLGSQESCIVLITSWLNTLCERLRAVPFRRPRRRLHTSRTWNQARLLQSCEVLEVRQLLSGPTSILGELSGKVAINGSLSAPTEIDNYTFTLRHDSEVYFDSLTNNPNFTWSLSGPAGSAVSGRSFVSSDGNAISNPVMSLVAGDYTLAVSGVGLTTGAYSFRLIDLGTAIPLTVNADTSGTLPGGNFTKAYQFAANAGDSFSFSSVATTAAGGDDWRVVDRYGDTVALGSLTTNLGTLSFAATGTYSLLVEGSITNTADATYTVHASFLGNTPPVISGTPLTLGTTVNGNLTTVGQHDAYTFTLASKSYLYFDSLTKNTNLNWSLVGPPGTVVSARPFSGSDGPNVDNPVLTLPAGNYALTVAGGGAATGPYSFRLSDLSAATALTPGTAVSGNLPAGINTDLYQFTATTGQSFYFANHVTSGTGSNDWRLVDPYGNIVSTSILSIDPGRLTLSSTGTYVILAEGAIGNTSAVGYTLNAIPEVDPAPQPLTLGNLVAASLGAPGERDVYTFNLPSSALLYFDSLTNSSNFNWSLTGPAGAVVSGQTFSNSDGTSVANAVMNLPAGTYSLTVAGVGNTTGAYSFRLSDLASAHSLTPGTPVSSTLAGGISTDLYQFTASAGQSFYFANHVTSGNGNTDWQLIDPFGQVISAPGSILNNDPGRMTLATTGKYTILAEGAINNTAALSYTLNVIPDVDLAPQPLTLGNLVSANLIVPGEQDAYTFMLASDALLYFDSLTNNQNIVWSLTGPAGSAVSGPNFNNSDGTSVTNPVMNLPAGTYTLTVSGTGAATGPYSFRLSDLAAVTALTPGTPVSATLAGGVSTALYQFNATAGQSFYFANHITSGSGSNDWRLIDPLGNIVSPTSLTLNTDPGRLTLNRTGRYVILAEGSVGNTQDLGYTQNVIPEVDPAAQPLTLGTALTGNLAVPGELDAYTFTLGGNALVYFDSLTNSSNFNWSLTGPPGSIVSGRAFNNSDGVNVTNPVVSLPAGTYSLTVTGAGAATGSYKFRLFDLGAASPLAVGTDVSGTLVGGNSTNAYRLATTAGDSYSFTSVTTSNAGNDDWLLVDPYGDVVASQSLGNNLGAVTLPATGNYTLLVEGFISNTADATYTVHAAFLGNTPPVVSGTALTLGTLVNGTLATSSQKDVYNFTLASSARLYFDSLTHNSGFIWNLSGPPGNAGSNDFDHSDGLTSTNPVISLPAGTYLLTVGSTGAATGAYSFRLSNLAAATALTLGTAVSGTLTGGISTDLYRFTATAGQSFYIADQVTSGSGGQNDRVRLIDPFGNIVPATLNSRLDADAGRVTLNIAGQYTVLVEGYIGLSSDLGYTLNVIPVVDPAPQALTLGTLVSANLSVPGRLDTYTFTLATKSQLYFDALTNNNKFTWSLTGPAGNAISAELFVLSDGLTNSTPVLNLVAGNYTLTVASAGATGAYSFRLSDLSAVQPLTLGTAVTGTLTGGISTDLYQFTATAGQSFYIADQVTSGNGGQNDRVRLVDPFGNIVSATLNGRLTQDDGRLTLTIPGRYVVLVEGYIGSPGDLGYTLNVVADNDPAPLPLTLGSLVNGNLSFAGKRDTYTFTLAANSHLYFDSLTDSQNFAWSLSGPAGNAVSAESFLQSDGVTNSTPVLHLLAGNYTLTVASPSGATGPYSFRLSDLSAAPALTFGTAVSGTLAGGISTDLYQFTATAGEAFYFANKVTSGTGAQNDRIRLVDPFGNVVPATQNSRPDTDIGRLTLTTTGKYTVLVEGYIDSPGDLGYTLNVIRDVDPPLTHFALSGLKDSTPATTYNELEGNGTGTVVLATFTAANPLAALADFTLSVDWGGALIGTPTAAVQLVSRTDDVSNWQVVGSAVYAEKGLYTVTPTVNQPDGANVNTTQTKFNVADAPLTDTTPVTVFHSIENASTGDTILATFSDADPSAPLADFTPIVNWGGALVGTPTVSVQLVSRTATVSNWKVVGNAIYAEEGNYTVTVNVNDADGSTMQTSKSSFLVADAALTDTTPVATLSALEGNSTGSVVLATFSDADAAAPLSDYTPTVDWGATLIGTPTVAVQLVSRTASVSNWQVVGTATYAEKGNDTVAVTINDVGGSKVQTTNTHFAVTDAPLTDTTPTATLSAVEGNSTGSVILATFTDGDPSAPLADFTPTVNWVGTIIGTPTVAVQLVSRTSTVSNWQVVGSAVYAEKGNFTPTVTVNDADGSSLQTSKTSFNVADAPLTDTTPTATLSAVEGNSTGNVILATFTDGDPSAPLADFTPTVNWVGTVIGTPTVAVQLASRTSAVSNWQIVGSAVYAEKGNFTPTVTVSDVDGGSLQTGKTSFNVADAPLTDTTPTTTINAVQGSSTGSVVLATFSDGDPSAPLADFTPTVNWGGTLVGTPTVAVQLVSRTASVSNWQVVGTATYASSGVFTVSVTVNDFDGSSMSTNKTSFSVTNAAASLTNTTPGQTFNATEGISTGSVTLATFSDADAAAPLADFSAAVNWGGTLIGTSTVAVQLVSRTTTASNWQVVGSATYAEAGTMIPTVTVNDSDGDSFQSTNTHFNVADAALSDTTPTATLNAVEGNSTGNVILATFTDGDPSAPLADFTPAVNWGGTVIGTPTVAVQFVSSTSSVSNWKVVGSAVYSEKGNFTPTVTVNDADGNSVQTTKTSFKVADAPVTDTTPTATLNAVEGNSTGNVILATFTDGDPSAPLADFTPTVNWVGTVIGTPTVSVQLVSRTSTVSNWQVTGSAVYAEKGNFTPTVTVNDADGSSLHTSKISFNVADAPLTDTTPASTVNAVAGTSTGNVILATFTDADPAAPLSDFTPSVNWGGTLVGTPAVAVQLVSRTSGFSSWQVIGSATYAAKETYTAAVTVIDVDGATLHTSQTQLSVSDAAQQLLSYSIQHGAIERSFIRFIDLSFNTTAGLAGFLKGQGIRLTFYAANGLHPTTVSLANEITVRGTHVTIDFGPNGIGGNRLTSAGDGTYRLALDLAGDGSFSTVVQFFRLFGDVNGDGSVDATDVAAFTNARNMGDINGDVNGDGQIDTRDLAAIKIAMGHTIKPPASPAVIGSLNTASKTHHSA